jgi:monofunctional biosynthetic peptidoglycan transglycosylase
VRFEQVQLVARRGAYLVEADLDAVDVTPSLAQLLDGLRVHPNSIDVDGGRVRITRAPASPQPEPEPTKQPAKPSASSVSKSVAPEAPVARKTRAVLHDVSVSVHPAPLPSTTRPLVLHRAEFLLTTGAGSTLEFRHGYGQLPDATPFGMRRLAGNDAGDGAAKGASTYVLEPEQPTRVDQWVATGLPLGMEVSEITMCPQCQPATVELGGLQFVGPAGISAQSRVMRLSASTSEVRVSLDDLNFDTRRTPLPYRLENFEAVHDSEAKTTIVQGDVRDADRGLASFASNWSGQWGVLETRVQLNEFQTAPIWPTLGLDDHAGGGVHSGKIEASYEPWLDLVELDVDLNTRSLTLDLPMVTGEPLEFGRVGLELVAAFQPRARTISVSSGKAALGEADPIDFGGYALDAGRGWVFETFALAENLHPQRLRDGLPPSLAKLARGTEFDGEFGFGIYSAGHTAFPESIELTVDFNGEVEVKGDSSHADVLALASDGPPSIDLPGTLARNVELDRWVDYGSLPEHVPQVLTAAEDAKFFSHDGFDWRGLRRALVHNVKEGGIVRGGSTLSQQLSKNLFLDHERTLARKLQEAYVTWRLESELSKKRILELYMNMVEWGPNLRGLKQAARRYFDIPPEELSVPQVALLASVLPGPSLFGQQVLSGYLPSSRVEKIEHILSNLRFLKVISGREYRKMYAGAQRGKIGGLELQVCDDDGKAPEGTPECP